MRILVTGASGWIGSAVVPELLGAGHEVVGLARSEASAQRLKAAGATVQRGDVDDPAGLAKAAADSDGVIHLAFQHEVAFGGNFAAAADADRRAVEAMGAALAGSDRPLVVASGTLGLTVGRVATEDDGLVPSAELRASPARRRAATALFTLSLAGRGVRSSVLRLPSTVHGDGDHAPAGSVLHAVADEGIPFREIAGAMGRHLGLPTRSLAAADAAEHFGYLGHFVTLDSPATAAITQELLAWKPTGPSLLEDLEQDYYYRQA